jgi:hypothetical protein
MSGDSVYHYGIHAVLGASLTGTPQCKRVEWDASHGSQRNRCYTRLEVPLWGNVVDNASSDEAQSTPDFPGDPVPRLII